MKDTWDIRKQTKRPFIINMKNAALPEKTFLTKVQGPPLYSNQSSQSEVKEENTEKKIDIPSLGQVIEREPEDRVSLNDKPNQQVDEEQIGIESKNLIDDSLPRFDFLLFDDEPPLLPSDSPMMENKDPGLHELLVTSDETSQSLRGDYITLSLASRRFRSLYQIPQFRIDTSDSLLRTLLNCQIGFLISPDGFIDSVEMLPPGTGSELYDKILLDNVRLLQFEPGAEDRGTIRINFEKLIRYDDD